jgi:hypothetical protein
VEVIAGIFRKEALEVKKEKAKQEKIEGVTHERRTNPRQQNLQVARRKRKKFSECKATKGVRTNVLDPD